MRQATADMDNFKIFTGRMEQNLTGGGNIMFQLRTTYNTTVDSYSYSNSEFLMSTLNPVAKVQLQYTMVTPNTTNDALEYCP